MDRLTRQQRYGSSALIAAVSLLAGVMLATLAQDRQTVSVGAGGGVAEAGGGRSTASTFGGGGGDDGFVTGDGGTDLGDGSIPGQPGAAGSGAGGGSGGPTDASAAAAGSPSDSGGPATGNSGASARGVTATEVKLGVAYLDLGALGQFPQFRTVPGDEAVAAVQAGLEKRGEVPIHGRKVTLKLVPYDVLNAEDQRAACQRLVKDEKVFAVAAHTVFEAGAECLAKDTKTPVIMPDPAPAAAIQSGAPFYFSLSMTTDTMGRNLVHFVRAKGLLKGNKVGMYWGDDNGVQELLAQSVKAELERVGIPLAAEQSTRIVNRAQAANPQPTADDQLAVRRFQQADVGLALLFGTQGRFMAAAEQQGYKAQYVNTDQDVGASDTTVSAYPADQADGMYAMTGTRRNEAKLGQLSPKARQCLDDYVAATGDRIDPIARESEWGSLAILCDVVYTAVEGLHQAGPNLTHASFVAGLERIRGLPLTMQGLTSFGPGRHAGGDGYRTLIWGKDGGYRIQPPAEFQPLWTR